MTQMSVVIAAYNARRTLSVALRSVAGQEVPVDEVILVDDGSSDDTMMIAETWRAELPLRIISNGANLGLATSLRRGVEATSFDWVLRLDADDEWLPCHVRMLKAASEVPGAVIVTSRAVYVDDSGCMMRKSRELSDSWIRARLMWDNPLVHSATGFSRRAYVNVGGYPKGKSWEDYWLWIQLLQVGSLVAVNEVTVVYVQHDGSVSRIGYTAAAASRWECQKEAIRLFWGRHPVMAFLCLMLGGRSCVKRGCQRLRGRWRDSGGC